ncbi:MAG TPA: hypothetical protein VGC81_18085 [Candidatus Methylomirabilis sp.]
MSVLIAHQEVKVAAVVHSVPEDSPPLVAPGDDMVEGAGNLYAGSTGHGPF